MMFEETKRLIIEKQQQHIFSGAVFQSIEKQQSETHVLGTAALLPTQEVMTRQHIFDVASLTKVVCTTTVILKLWEQNQLLLDMPLKYYLPEYIDERVTLRHLLTHTAAFDSWIPNRDQLSAEQLRQAYLRVPSTEKLGQLVKYTDTGMILLGFMLERIFDKKLTTIFQEEVLQPLAMNHSYFPPIYEANVVPTQKQLDGSILKGMTHDPKARILGAHAGNAGLFTTIDDLARFVQMYLQGGMSEGKAFLKESTIHALCSDFAQTENRQRSLGWDLLNEDILYHTGYTGTFLLIDPLYQSAFIFLSNRVHPFDHRQEYCEHRDEIIESYLKEKAIAENSCYNSRE